MRARGVGARGIRSLRLTRRRPRILSPVPLYGEGVSAEAIRCGGGVEFERGQVSGGYAHGPGTVSRRPPAGGRCG